MVSIRSWFGLEARKPRVTTLTATDMRDVLTNNSPAGWEVTQPWLQWLPAPGGEPPVWGNPIPGAGYPGPGLTLPAVTRCTSIICDTIAGLPWQVFTGWQRADPTPNWIADPQALRTDGRVVADSLSDVKLSGVEFWAQWICSALWWGDGYVYVPVRDAAGLPKPPLWVLNPHRVDIDDGRYFANQEELPPGSVLHLRGEPPYWNGHGVGVLERHGADLGLAASVREYAAGQYHSGIPSGYLKSTQPHMDATQAADLKRKWMEQHGESARSIAILNATTEFVPLAISPLDAQLDNARTWAARDIAMAFGLPPYTLGVPGDSSTYANVESRAIELRQYSLLPWVRRIEACLDAQFPRGTELHINTDALMRADTATRYAAYKIALDTGIATRDEIRALENLPPLGSTADDSLPNDHPGTPPGDTMSNPPPLSMVKDDSAEEVTA